VREKERKKERKKERDFIIFIEYAQRLVKFSRAS